MIEQRNIFELIGKPKGYDDFHGWQKFNLRQNTHKRFKLMIEQGHNEKFAAHVSLEGAKISASYYMRQNIENARLARCGASRKRDGKPCKAKPIEGAKRCKYHGGLSTGPKSLEGRIKALSGLKQYQGRPDLLAQRIEAIKAQYTADNTAL